MTQLASLRDQEHQLLKEKEEILTKLKGWDEEIAWKKYAAVELEKTLEALRKGSTEERPRCAAELRRATATAVGKPEEETSQDTEELLKRFATSLTELSKPLENSWSEESFKRQFEEEEGPLAEFLKGLASEQRLVWELQNVVEISPRVDRRLLADLKKAGKTAEVDVLTAAGGLPTDVERQYRPLLWLRHHEKLNASHVEPGAASQSLLTIACRYGHCDVAAALLERKADLHHRSNSQLTALAAACQTGSTTCVRLLLQAAADCNEVSKGSSVLALAARYPAEGLAMTRLLLEFRANPNQADPFGQTPLMVAAAARNLRCCEALLEAGACVTDEDNEGKNAAELAKEQGLDGLAAKLCAK